MRFSWLLSQWVCFNLGYSIAVWWVKGPWQVVGFSAFQTFWFIALLWVFREKKA